jgi:hypothetical protein
MGGMGRSIAWVAWHGWVANSRLQREAVHLVHLAWVGCPGLSALLSVSGILCDQQGYPSFVVGGLENGIATHLLGCVLVQVLVLLR